MVSKNMRRLLFIISLLFLSTCSSSNPTATHKEDAFFTLVDAGEDCNHTLKFVVLPGFEKLRQGRVGWLSLDIDSQTTIWFRGDLNMRLLVFTEDTNQWIEVENEMNFNPKPFEITGKEDYEGDVDVLFIVDLPLENPASSLRVYVEGKIVEDEQPTDQKVSAFIDLPIEH